MAKPTTVKDYLATLPEERGRALATVRGVIRKNLPAGYKEGVQYGMIGYFVPHSIYPAGYHANPKEPLPFICLGSQKNYMVLHLMCLYGDAKLAAWFTKAYAASGKKLDMGKGCVRFKSVDDLAIDVLTGLLEKLPVATYVNAYERMIPASKRTKSAKVAKKKASKPTTKTTAKKTTKKKS